MYLLQIKKTNLKNYGCENPSQSKEIQDKKLKTMMKNKSFNKSDEEELIFEMLCTKFSIVSRQYSSNKYPFACDFYVPEKNLYVEYQGHWTHGKHPFNENNAEDVTKLKSWKNKNTEYYLGAINTWTIRDPMKRKAAKDNNLNWIEFFTLKEFEEWFNLQ